MTKCRTKATQERRGLFGLMAPGCSPQRQGRHRGKSLVPLHPQSRSRQTCSPHFSFECNSGPQSPTILVFLRPGQLLCLLLKTVYSLNLQVSDQIMHTPPHFSESNVCLPLLSPKASCFLPYLYIFIYLLRQCSSVALEPILELVL